MSCMTPTVLRLGVIKQHKNKQNTTKKNNNNNKNLAYSIMAHGPIVSVTTMHLKMTVFASIMMKILKHIDAKLPLHIQINWRPHLKAVACCVVCTF